MKIYLAGNTPGDVKTALAQERDIRRRVKGHRLFSFNEMKEKSGHVRCFNFLIKESKKR